MFVHTELSLPPGDGSVTSGQGQWEHSQPSLGDIPAWSHPCHSFWELIQCTSGFQRSRVLPASSALPMGMSLPEALGVWYHPQGCVLVGMGTAPRSELSAQSWETTTNPKCSLDPRGKVLQRHHKKSLAFCFILYCKCSGLAVLPSPGAALPLSRAGVQWDVSGLQSLPRLEGWS